MALVSCFSHPGRVRFIEKHVRTFLQGNITRRRSQSTLTNLLVGKDTRVLYQGLTGRTATENAKDAIANGTRIVGGVSPGKGGREHLNVPVFDTVREAMEAVKPDASLVYVSALAAGKAIEESVVNEIPLIVAIAEHVPVHDMLRIHQMLRTQTKSRLVGPNTPGLLVPERCRLGIIPFAQTTPGIVGIASRSGTMIYEAIGATTRTGLGQSLVIGLGGDLMPGTTMPETTEMLLHHSDTKLVLLIGEIGGRAELEAAEVVKRYNEDTSAPKPVVAIISGRTAPPGKVMGHAGALLGVGDVSVANKAEALKRAGAHVIDHLGELEETLLRVLPK